MSGFVKLHRAFLDWEWYDNDACVRVMVHLLLTVNWEPRKWHGQTIQPGQLVTSMEGLSKTLGMTRTSVRRTFDRLKSSGEVTIQTNNHWTTVTLVKWAKYQSDDTNSDRPVSRPVTDHRPTSDRPVATTKEVKKVRSKEKRTTSVVLSRSLADRKLDFVEACRVASESDPTRLPKSLRTGFVEYWTEPTQDGKAMRFESEKYFDHSRRMATWKANATKRGELVSENWNPRA